jgi:prephenate dehydrogenase
MVGTPEAAADSPSVEASLICIVGLGLIGGSLALALRQRAPHVQLVGVDRASAAERPSADLVHAYVAAADAAAVERAFSNASLIVLATPVSEIQRWLARALGHAAVVTDCGSTKREIAAAAQAHPDAARFVPGHPMAGAGRARAAPSAALFVGRPWLLCSDRAEPDALDRVERMVKAVGATPLRMSAVEHDRAVAWTSHAPRIVSSVFTVLAARERALLARGPAFERLMRGAGGPIGMWADVLSSNRDEVAHALRRLIAELEACAEELEGEGELERSLAALRAADEARDSVVEAPQSAPR